ncbi:MAG: hypothetical protein NC078_03915 [Ruminococcus sp.]|nr:hypothetical protein [Ruminococcus sp.]
MLIKPVTYVNYNGEEITENICFNLSSSELMEMELTTDGGFVEHIKKITDAKDQPEIFKLFKQIILKSYGEKSPDGKHFMKTDPDGRPLSRLFEQTEAYNVLLMELATDADTATKFVNAIVPKDIAEKESDSKVIDVTSK